MKTDAQEERRAVSFHWSRALLRTVVGVPSGFRRRTVLADAPGGTVNVDELIGKGERAE